MKNSTWVIIVIFLVFIGSFAPQSPIDKQSNDIVMAVLWSAYFICKAIEKQKQ
jgi:hypothetical protein